MAKKSKFPFLLKRRKCSQEFSLAAWEFCKNRMHENWNCELDITFSYFNYTVHHSVQLEFIMPMCSKSCWITTLKQSLCFSSKHKTVWQLFMKVCTTRKSHPLKSFCPDCLLLQRRSALWNWRPAAAKRYCIQQQDTQMLISLICCWSRCTIETYINIRYH